MKIIRSTLFYIGYSVSLILIGLISTVLLIFPIKSAANIVIAWNRFVMFWLKVCCGIRFQLKGNLKPLPTPCVIVANHQSPWETIFFQLYCFPLTTVLKQELLRIPFFGWGMRVLKPIAIDRSSPVQALKQIKKVGVQRLQQGQNVLVFPEGTRQPVENLGTFARSGADIAKAANVPLIVIAHDAGNYWHNKQFLKTSGTVQVTISEPIVINDSTKAAMMQARDFVKQSLDTK